MCCTYFSCELKFQKENKMPMKWKSEIICRPSTSEDEQIHNDFNFAEQNGANGLCEHYSADCPQTVFDFITVFESS